MSQSVKDQVESVINNNKEYVTKLYNKSINFPNMDNSKKIRSIRKRKYNLKVSKSLSMDKMEKKSKISQYYY